MSRASSPLRTYTHLMEGSSERTKRAVDSVFKPTRSNAEPDQGAAVDDAVDDAVDGSEHREESANDSAEPK